MLELVDRALQWLVRHQGNNVPVPVHPLMAAGYPSPYADEGYETWLPITSTVTKQQLDDLEVEIGQRLPPDYRAFLQYKHFYDLYLGRAEFLPHPVDEWPAILREQLLANWPPECQHTGLITFAYWGGAGDELCFDTTQQQATADYPVVLWNHEDYSTELFSASFATLLPQLLAETPERDV